ncbi:hypothetical protein BAU15_14625 [Enterococcus sp. JM4C]|uniref:hypothetical protein n=1 Tax=Candidatus Enterococcus huntleyi TaxID=1857217 RepID=UPI00137AB39B|nr:hypothetical protein [Enterococcus sp. JM4C]KAF1296574.1 hypothetical protein BAU15_14625 [Enterococcus sp. JM4C]
MKLTKITNKNDYMKILNFLEKQTKYIEILQLMDDNQPNFIIEKYRAILVTQKTVSNWNDTGAKGLLYKFDLNLAEKERIFKDLKKIDPFFYNKFDIRLGETVENTDFGYANIAFFDIKGKLVFYTITHEGLAWIQS